MHEADEMFEAFLAENDPDILAIAKQPALAQDDTPLHVLKAPTASIMRAIDNFKASTGKADATIQDVEASSQGLIYWSCSETKMGAHAPGGFHQRFLRSLAWNEAASSILGNSRRR